mgnify:FL=1|jgi:hypothetical protein|tara:strand:+ start:535 stop:774 length:240 start_codon:yes stop_codon:yes gene_type:complete
MDLSALIEATTNTLQSKLSYMFSSVLAGTSILTFTNQILSVIGLIISIILALVTARSNYLRNQLAIKLIVKQLEGEVKQ